MKPKNQRLVLVIAAPLLVLVGYNVVGAARASIAQAEQFVGKAAQETSADVAEFFAWRQKAILSLARQQPAGESRPGVADRAGEKWVPARWAYGPGSSGRLTPAGRDPCRCPGGVGEAVGWRRGYWAAGSWAA